MKRFPSILTIFSLLVTLLTLPNCVKSVAVERYVKNGEEYGVVRGAFRHRWWNYFERGVSLADGKFYDEAIKDLKIAISKRFEDQRRARTYGMHFVDYFPHRELGVIYYLTGSVPEAKEELELSLSQYPSAKAYFYLDLVRKASFGMEGEKFSPPTLLLDLKEKEVWTKDETVVISGRAEDKHFVSTITINNVPVFIEGSKQSISFRREMSLSHGEHKIEVVATNLLGKSARGAILFHIDRMGPTISLEEFRVEQFTPIHTVFIKGSALDDGGIEELRIDNRPILMDKGKEGFFHQTVETGKKELEIMAIDRMGNRTVAVIPITGRSETDRRKGIKANLLASANPRLSDRIMVALLGKKDKIAPLIDLKDWTGSETVFMEKIYLDGEVSDESEIKTLTINQKPLPCRNGSILFFNYLMDLKEGKNEIVIKAEDREGNIGVENLFIMREVPRSLQLEERMSVTIVPFEQKGEISEACLAFQDNLMDSMVSRNRFNIIEREKLDLILSEQKLSRSGLIDKETAIRLGRLIAARCVMTGSIIESHKGIEIVGRLIDTETSKILSTQDVYDEVKDLSALRSLAEGLALKLHREFPLVEGVVVQQKGRNIFTDLGHDRIKLDRHLIVYREEPVIHPKTGKELGKDNVIIGCAKVNQVMPEMSRAVFFGENRAGIKEMDKVITE